MAKAKTGCAKGFDELPVEVLRSDIAIHCLHKLFSKCFDTCMAPDLLVKGIINPITKNSSKDRREPLNYRGITLSSCVYRLYCSILNCRIGIWAEENDLIDEQNGFRKGRSCQDHLSSTTSIIETGRQANRLTYVASVDFSKAYDHIAG